MFIELTNTDGTKFMLMIALIIGIERREDGRSKIAFQTRDKIEYCIVSENYSTIRDILRDENYLLS